MNKETQIEKMRLLISHIEEVQKNCKKLGFRLMEENETELGRKLIANGFIHDNSKFHAIEWLHLTHPDEDDELLNVAIRSHVEHNMHHPEFWGGIKNMPRMFVAEMVCDWKARSSELGQDLKEWIENGAMRKFKFTKRDKIFKEIMFFVDLLLEKSL